MYTTEEAQQVKRLLIEGTNAVQSVQKSQEEVINDFLDKILDYKKNLLIAAKSLESLNDRFISLTRFDYSNVDVRSDLEPILRESKDFHLKCLKMYISTKRIREKGIGREEAYLYKDELDALREVLQDIDHLILLGSEKSNSAA